MGAGRRGLRTPHERGSGNRYWMFGLYVAIFERRPRLGMAITAIAFGYFLLMTTLVIPSVKLGYYPQLRFFADLGHSKWEILLSPLTKPRLFWGKNCWRRNRFILRPHCWLPRCSTRCASPPSFSWGR